jgi:ubiquitin-protein ligase
MTPRLRRLAADHRRIVEALADHPHIRLVDAEGTPPERYAFEFRVSGLTLQPDGSPVESAVHRAEVFLPLDYPRRPPFCRMTTPVFHPNIDPQKICIGDHWSAGQSLLELVVRIAQMICFQSYNTQSPLNAKAALWASEHASRLPLQAVDLSRGL